MDAKSKQSKLMALQKNLKMFACPMIRSSTIGDQLHLMSEMEAMTTEWLIIPLIRDINCFY